MKDKLYIWLKSKVFKFEEGSILPNWFICTFGLMIYPKRFVYWALQPYVFFFYDFGRNAFNIDGYWISINLLLSLIHTPKDTWFQIVERDSVHGTITIKTEKRHED